MQISLGDGIKKHLVTVAKPRLKTQTKKGIFDMEFLREILGEELFKQFEEKVNAYNGNEANKEKQIKIGNLGSGEYVGKGKHDSEIEKLNNLLASKSTELESANGLIAELKKSTKGNEEMQGKITTYEQQVADLQQQLEATKINSAVKVALLSEKAVDIDYLTFKINEKLREQGKALELDENENIKGWDDVLSGLKTQYPSQFESVSGERKVLGDNRLPKSEERSGYTKQDLLKMPYSERDKIFNKNPEAYRNIMKS